MEQNSERRKRSEKCGRLIFNKDGKGNAKEQSWSFQQMMLQQLDIHMLKKKKESAHPSKKFNSK